MSRNYIGDTWNRVLSLDTKSGPCWYSGMIYCRQTFMITSWYKCTQNWNLHKPFTAIQIVDRYGYTYSSRCRTWQLFLHAWRKTTLSDFMANVYRRTDINISKFHSIRCPWGAFGVNNREILWPTSGSHTGVLWLLNEPMLTRLHLSKRLIWRYLFVMKHWERFILVHY